MRIQGKDNEKERIGRERESGRSAKEREREIIGEI